MGVIDKIEAVCFCVFLISLAVLAISMAIKILVEIDSSGDVE